MANEILRMNYFDGLKLFEDEFIKEQNYHIRMRRLHNRYLHKPGIVSGMTVEKKGPDPTHKVAIREGMALNEVKEETNNENVSQEIINIINDYEMDFSTELDFQSVTDPKEKLKPGDVYICASYLKEKEGDEQDHYDPTTKKVVKEKIHLKETAKFQASNRPPENPAGEKIYILLGKVKINANKAIISNVDTSLCEYSGPRGASISADSYTLSVAKATGTFATINGKYFSSLGGYGIQVNSPQTEFSGPLKIQGNVEITGNLTVNGRDISKGWVRLPFLPKRTIYAPLPKFDSKINHSISHDKGACGVMEIPVPTGATKIKQIRIAGRNSGLITIILWRAGINYKDSKELLTQVIKEYGFDVYFPISTDLQFLGSDSYGLALYVEASTTSDIYLIAVEFE